MEGRGRGSQLLGTAPFSPKETQVFSLSGGGWFPPSFTFGLLPPFLPGQGQIIRYPGDSATQQPSDQSPLTLPSGEKNWAEERGAKPSVSPFFTEREMQVHCISLLGLPSRRVSGWAP